MDHPNDQACVHISAVAAPGLLARIAVLLNPHPVAAFEFEESPDGSVRVIVRLRDTARTWDLQRVVARLNRAVDTTLIQVGAAVSSGVKDQPNAAITCVHT